MPQPYKHPATPGDPAIARITIWLPSSERTKIEHDATQAGVSLSAYLRGLAKTAQCRKITTTSGVHS